MPDGRRWRRLPDAPSSLLSARPAPDLAAAGFREEEYVVTGTARSYAADATPPDGRWRLRPDATAEFATRVALRRPTAPEAFSGTVVVEWLNVSSGADAAPDWTFLAEEILRQGHAWAGVSAQYVGVEGGGGSVRVGDLDLPGLRDADPERFGDLHHPGDAFAYDIFGGIADDLDGGGPMDDLDVEAVLAVGESQSGMLLTTYVNGVHPVAPVVDGVLLHSRAAIAPPVGEAGRGMSVDDVLRGGPVTVRDDLDVPVLVVQTEGDLFDRIGYLPARQPDSDRIRVWEVAGSAHADRYTIDEFESVLDCAVPVNRGQQAFVVRAGLRHLDRWARGGDPPPVGPRLEIAPDGDDVARDSDGNAVGGVRTPVVDAPVETLSGRAWPGSSTSCRLFGSTTAWTRDHVEQRYGGASGYETAYAAACDAGIRNGFLLPEDRDQILAEARPWPT